MIYGADGKPAPRTPYRFSIFDWLAILHVALLIFFAWFNPALGAEVTHQISTGQPFSSVYLPSLPQSTASRVVYVQDAATNGANELWSAPIDGGAPVRLSQALASGQSVKFSMTPDGAKVAYVTDQTTRGIPDLYSVPITGGASVKLSMDLTSFPGQVRDFLISPTSQRVYYAADGAVNNVIELWRVDVAGGPSTRLNAAISGNYDVFEYHVSPQDQIVYRVGRATVGGHELWTVPGNGRSSQARKISRTMVTGGGVDDHFKITEDGSRVVYRCDCEDNGEFNLYSVAIGGGSSVRLNAISGGVVGFAVSPPTQSETTLFEQRIGAVTSWWSVPVTGGTPVPAPPPMPVPVKSPDGQWIVYGAGVGLWSSGPSGTHQLVSCAGQTVTSTFIGMPTYSVSPDSSTVIYVAGELWASPISGSVCLIWKDGFESGSTEAWQ